MLQIKRAGHSTLTTPDIERMIDYFTRIVGLSLAAREKNRAILATKSGLEAIVLERGSAVEAPRLSFQVAPDSDLGEVASRLKKAGIKSERRSDITPGIGEAIAFKDPKGTTLEIFSDFAFAAEDYDFHRRHAAQVRPHRLSVPRRAGRREILLRHARFSRVGLAQRFLRLPALQPRPSHREFPARRRNRRSITSRSKCATGRTSSAPAICWRATTSSSPGVRSATSSATTSPIYHKNPDGVTIEFFCDMDQMFDEELGFFEPRPWHQDRPQRPKVWGDDTPSNWWGPMSRGTGHSDPAAPKPASEPSRQAAPAARAPALAPARSRQAEKKSRKTTKPRR